MSYDARKWCAQGLHEQHGDGGQRCTECGEPVGSVLDTDPYDFPAAQRELRSVHAWLRKHGLHQADGDGQWGQSTGYYEPEWDEAGNTVQAIGQIAARVFGDNAYWRGVERYECGATKLPALADGAIVFRVSLPASHDPVVIVTAVDREEAKRRAAFELGHDPDRYIVEPLTQAGAAVTVLIGGASPVRTAPDPSASGPDGSAPSSDAKRPLTGDVPR